MKSAKEYLRENTGIVSYKFSCPCRGCWLFRCRLIQPQLWQICAAVELRKDPSPFVCCALWVLRVAAGYLSPAAKLSPL